jgi:hypothetical protein
MNWIWCLNHNLQHEKPGEPTSRLLEIWLWTLNLEPSIIICQVGVASSSHSRRCWNTVYMYKVDRLWVWSVWGASIIRTYNMLQATSVECRTQHTLLCLSPPTTYKACQTHFIYIWNRSGMSMRWMGGPNHILQHVPSENPTRILRLALAHHLLEWWHSMVLWQYDCQP